MARPGPPGKMKIAGKGEASNLSTHEKSEVTVEAAIRQTATDKGQVRLVVYASKTKSFPKKPTKVSDWGGSRTERVTLRNLDENTHYYLRVFVEQKNLDKLSKYNSTDFWTERAPAAPVLQEPAENVTFTEEEDVTVKWRHVDADTKPQDPQSRAQVSYRVAATSMEGPGSWNTVYVNGTTAQYTIQSTSLSPSNFYEWQVRTKDTHSSYWGEWAQRSFYVVGTTKAPRLDYPVNNEAAPVDGDLTFTWTFRDPQSGDSQTRADLRYRAVGAESGEGDSGTTWTTLTGDPEPGVPGDVEAWTVQVGALQSGYRYEWQVRTYDSLGNPSAWSNSAHFYSILTPGSANDDGGDLLPTVAQGSLGSGTYRVFAYDRGGQRIRGEITPLRSLSFSRVRDDISSANLRTNGFGADCCDLLGDLRTWAHEIVIFRDGERVWEGPITRIAYQDDTVEIEARDVMVYAYRRIMRQGYNDSNRKVKGVQMGTRTVVDRAALILTNALAPSDPNVLPWLTRFDYPDDAKQARSVADWSKTAWEEVDDMAATAGLDYTVVGRRIILNDTHRPIGLISEMRNGDFFSPPVITEYGMNAANVFGVTNNSGLHGEYEMARKLWGDVGPIELLASAYGESASPGASTRTLTAVQRSKQEAVLDAQASRNINGRWPPPLVARIPDNSRIHPDAYVGINQLVPGVHIPLRAQTACREFVQVQKLDSVNVTVEEGLESVQVIMSPAPDPSIDPDAEGAAEAE